MVCGPRKYTISLLTSTVLFVAVVTARKLGTICGSFTVVAYSEVNVTKHGTTVCTTMDQTFALRVHFLHKVDLQKKGVFRMTGDISAV